MEAIPESAWLRDAIRITFAGLDKYTATEGESGPPEQRDPRFRKLVEGVLWSKKFILTYHLVILSVLIIISAANWSETCNRWRKRRTATKAKKSDGYEETSVIDVHRHDGEASSSGSSTIEGNATPPLKIASEDTPLLHSKQQQNVRPTYRLMIDHITAALMYQPRPIPFVNKILPNNGMSVFIMLFIALQFFYAFYNINLNWFELFVFADRCGLVFAVNLPLLYLMAAKTQPIRFLTGFSYESLNIFHRRLGEVLCLTAMVHTLGMIGVWYTLFRPIGFTFLKFMLEQICLLGLGALICFETLYFTSLASFRQRFYELFLGLHVLLQTGALVFLFFHHESARPYVGAALGIFAVDRLVYRLGVKSQFFQATGEVLEDGDTVRLCAIVELQERNLWSSIFGRSVVKGWEATDHVFLTVPALGKTHSLQAHPFTIASAAPDADSNVANLELLIRAQNGFSADLLRELQKRKSLRVRLDGPYGSSHARDILSDSDVAILVAGGSGIAVCWPLIQYLLSSSETDLESSRKRQKTIILIWVIHKATHLSWIGRDDLQKIEHQGVETLIPRATEEVGRPDLGSILAQFVGKTGQNKSVAIVGSGPDSMGRAVRNTSASLVKGGRKVEVTIEKFGW